ncbi:MAG TPA: transporter substrate-binding domain-containing protein [Methanospirillum sp.]|nr:transporter substrate-binding domain-containing protein [Methanospirillum sp.]
MQEKTYITRNPLRLLHPLIIILLLLASLIPATGAENHTIYQYWAEENYPPFEFRDESGNPAGYSVDIIRAVADEMGFEVEVRTAPWSEIKQALTDHRIDLSGSMAYDANRTDRFAFSAPITTVRWFLYVPKNSSITTLEELHDKRIILANGDIWEEKLKLRNFPADLVIVPGYRDQLRGLATGEYDAAIINKITASYLMEQEGIDSIKPVGEPLEELHFCIATHKSEPIFINQINEGLILLSRNGKYDQIAQKWFAPVERDIWADIYRMILLYVIIPLVVIGLIVIIWIWSLRRIISTRTGELKKELHLRKEAEVALRESEVRYRTLFTTMTEGVAICELISDETGSPADYRIIDVNDAYLYHTGRDPEQVRGKLASEVYGKEIPPFLDVYGKVVSTGESVSFEGHYASNQRTYQISAISPQSGTFAILFRDITDLKGFETERAKYLSQIEKNLVEFTVLNDQVRNPLSVIAVLVELHAPSIENSVNEQINNIDTIINRLDVRWMESEKVINYLKRHHGVEVTKQSTMNLRLADDNETP